MVSQPESPTYDPGVYEYEVTDPVQGGLNGIANLPLLNLANRTTYLKQRLDLLVAGAIIPPTIAPLNGPAFTGSTTAPNVAPGDDSTLIANTDFVQTRHHGIAVVSVGGNTNVTLTQSQWGVGILVFTGVLTGPVSVLFPASAGLWQVANRATGAFALTCKTAAGSGTVIDQAMPYIGVWCDGTSIWPQQSLQLPSVPRSGSFGPAGSLGGMGTTNWAVPALVTRIRMRCWSGGGGGGGSSIGQGAGGGGSGAYAEGIYPVTPGQVLSVFVGAGAPGGQPGILGGTGGDSFVTGFLQATGGRGGEGASPWAGGPGGAATFGNILNLGGGHGCGGDPGTQGRGGDGAAAPMGGPGDGASSGATGGQAREPGGAGAGFGGGSAGAGSNGANGIILFDW